MLNQRLSSLVTSFTSSCCGRFSPFPITALASVGVGRASSLPFLHERGGFLWRTCRPSFPFSSASPDIAAQPSHMQGVVTFQWEGISTRAVQSVRNSRCALENVLPAAACSIFQFKDTSQNSHGAPLAAPGPVAACTNFCLSLVPK